MAFANDVAGASITDGRITVVERHLSNDLLEVLNMADQAKLEGLGGRANSTAAIEAAGFLIRIAYRFQTIARARMTGLEAALPQDLRQSCAILERGSCSSLESALDKLRSAESSQPLTTQAITTDPTKPTLNSAEGLTRALFQEADLTSYAGTLPVTLLETYQRLPILLSRLDSALAKIAVY